jgi:GNAT superfamily N-acetyltransferase
VLLNSYIVATNNNITSLRIKNIVKMTLSLSIPKFERYQNESITDELLEDAAKLFSTNYGKWSVEATKKFGRFAKNGSRVHLSTLRLRNQCLPDGVPCTHVRVLLEGKLVGHVFAARWVTETGKTVCWVTQLVVHTNYRERGLATALLRRLKENGEDDIYGIMSSHPAACKAAAIAFGSKYSVYKAHALTNFDQTQSTISR